MKRESVKLNALFAAKDFAEGKLRFEARICKTYLSKNNYPTNLFELIHLQRMQFDLLRNLWGIAFNPIFKALEGVSMTIQDDDKVFELLKAKLYTVNSKGEIIYTKAKNAFKFYLTLKSQGMEQAKQIYSEPTYFRNVKTLIDCGLSKAYLQNLHEKPSNVIPFVKLVQIDFDSQLPPNYVEPVSKYQSPFAA